MRLSGCGAALGAAMLLCAAAAHAGSPPAIPLPQKGAVNGVATLDGTGQVPVSELGNSSGGLSPTGDASATTVTVSGGSARAQSLLNADTTNLLNRGAACDGPNGTTDDSAKITAAIALGKPIYIDAGLVCNATSLAASALTGIFFGPGKIKTSDGNTQLPTFTVQNVAPTILGNSGDLSTAGNGDFSHTVWTIGKRVVDSGGGHTLGQPSSGFVLSPENSTVNIYTENDSGWNQDTNGPGGRTSVAGINQRVYQNGAGGLIALNQVGTLFATGNKLGATTFLADPALELEGGSITAVGDGGFAQLIGDKNCVDNGHDIACIGLTLNYSRTNATGALGTTWMGIRQHSIGTVPIDSFIADAGKTGIGQDHTAETFPDQVMASWSIVTPGSGYSSGTPPAPGDLVYPNLAGATCDTAPYFIISTVSGGGVPTALAPVQAGKCSVPPSGTVTTTTNGAGTGLTLSVQSQSNAAEVFSLNERVYGAGSSNFNLASTRFSNATILGTDWFEDDGTDGWRWYQNGIKQFTMNAGGMTARNNFTFLDAIALPIRTVTGNGPFSQTTTDFGIIVNRTSPGASTVNLVASPVAGRWYFVQDGKGDAGTNNITVFGAGNSIDGAANYKITANYGWVLLVSDGTNWFIMSAGPSNNLTIPGTLTVKQITNVGAPTGVATSAGALVTGSTNMRGTVAMSASGATTVTETFDTANPFSGVPFCAVSGSAPGATVASTVTSTVLTILLSNSTNANMVTWNCVD